MAGLADRIYAKLPVLGQHAAISAFGLYWNWLRFGADFHEFVSQYRQRERWTTEQWNQWQQKAIREHLSAALAVPYYRDNWSASEKLAARSGVLADLPLLNKDPLRDNARSFLREDLHPRRPLITPTSGSSGTPINNYWTWREYRNTLALREVRSAGWAGVSYKDPRATFSGRMVVPEPNSPGPFHRFNLVERQVYFSAFHLRPQTVQQYVDALHKHQTKWMTGYAVSYYLMADMMLQQGIAPPKSLRAVITTSEKVTPEMRTVMEKAFGCRVFEEYSTVENCIFASECEAGSLHVSPDVSVVEILRPDGSPCDPEEPGEVVTTCLMRDYQPMIRFRLGDVAAWSAEPCTCGRSMPVLKEVVGRLEDVVVGPDGRRMVRFHGVFVGQPHVREGQVIQETRNRIRLKVVPKDGFGAADVSDLQARIQQRLGEVEVIVQTVDEIPRTKAGKFKAVINLMQDETDAEKAAAQHVAH
jgi:phenylacetate-CoA ligase